jgi:capsular exopolysaccharide synthesis family protein
LLIAPRPGTEIGEQFRVLRTRVETAGPGTFMITSALDQEGKSLCVANLAAALSMSIGGGVILVDADLRNPSIERAFKLPRGPGLVDCLLGEASWNECLQSAREGLKVLPAGRGSAMSTELLGSDRMLTLLAELKSHFPDHHVLVDAPPLLLTADPLVLARHMDHVLLVVRAGVTPRDAVLKAIETLGTERFLGIVFNDVVETASHHYYYGRYPYGRTESTRQRGSSS